MTSLPPSLLEQLLTELSTLASVYHKPPESFVGKGRFGADEIQRAAIQEQRQNATDDPIAASIAAAGANGTGSSGPSQNNIENLLDIDFDGAAPASQEQNSATATPDRMASPAAGTQSGAMADMMSMFDAPAPQASNSAQGGMGGMGDMAGMSGMGGASGAGGMNRGSGMNDLMNGFEGMNFGGPSNEPGPAASQLHGDQSGSSQQQQPKKDSDDLLGLL